MTGTDCGVLTQIESFGDALGGEATCLSSFNFKIVDELKVFHKFKVFFLYLENLFRIYFHSIYLKDVKINVKIDK